MRKGLVLAVVLVLALTIVKPNMTTASPGTELSVDPTLIQDKQVKPGEPSSNSYPSANAFNGTVTNPAHAYDKLDTTYAKINITSQPYTSKNSYPSAYSTNVSGGDLSTPALAYDKIQTTCATIKINSAYPVHKYFAVTTFNTTILPLVSSINVKMNYSFTYDAGKPCNYTVWLYVGSKSRILQDWTNVSRPTPSVGVWIGVTEPNDGVWSETDVDNMQVRVGTQGVKSTNNLFKIYEAWATAYEPNPRYFRVQTYNSTKVAGYSSLDVKMRFNVTVSNCTYRISVQVVSKNTILQDWTNVSRALPDLTVWTGVTEPNNGFWNQTDVDNMKVIVETQKTKSASSGVFNLYETWAQANPPPVNSYPSNHENTATVTDPEKAYDKDQMTYASISPPTTSYTYYSVKAFNSTVITNYASIDIKIRYSFTGYQMNFSISLYVGTASTVLQIATVENVTSSILATWTGVVEPNDGSWNQTDLNSMQVRVTVAKTTIAGSGTFREYETWASIPKDNFTVRINIAEVTNLCTWQFNLTFNSLVLQAVTVHEGPFLKKAGATRWAGTIIDNSTGWVLAGDSLSKASTSGATGSGLLATVTFKAVAKGNSVLDLSLGETKLRLWNGSQYVPIPYTPFNGFFQYQIGDANNDGKVDTADLHDFNEAYGSLPSSPNWNTYCDFNRDSKVALSDLYHLGKNYGQG